MSGCPAMRQGSHSAFPEEGEPMAQAHAIQMDPPSTDPNGLPNQDVQQPRGTNEVTRQGVAAPIPDQGIGNVDKIREILFGSQIREYESRFARLEERLVDELADL